MCVCLRVFVRRKRFSALSAYTRVFLHITFPWPMRTAQLKLSLERASCLTGLGLLSVRPSLPASFVSFLRPRLLLYGKECISFFLKCTHVPVAPFFTYDGPVCGHFYICTFVLCNSNDARAWKRLGSLVGVRLQTLQFFTAHCSHRLATTVYKQSFESSCTFRRSSQNKCVSAHAQAIVVPTLQRLCLFFFLIYFPCRDTQVRQVLGTLLRSNLLVITCI